MEGDPSPAVMPAQAGICCCCAARFSPSRRRPQLSLGWRLVVRIAIRG